MLAFAETLTSVTPRSDAEVKTSGKLKYVADQFPSNGVWAAVVRSTARHAVIRSIEVAEAKGLPGVLGVFTAADVTENTFGRGLRDTPVLARDKVRFIGEPVAAVVAETRQAAEAACGFVVVQYEEIPAVTSIDEALAPDAPLVHDAPWSYPGSALRGEIKSNVLFSKESGDPQGVERIMCQAPFVVDHLYRTSSVHQGYLEPQACLAEWTVDGMLRIWVTNKSPYALRSQLSLCLGIEKERIDVQPTPIGGDFGGKGSPESAPLAAELSRLVGRPVKIVLRYSEDLTSTNPRHPSQFRVRLACDRNGSLLCAGIEAVFNAGAYGGFTPRAPGPSGVEIGSYRIPVVSSNVQRVYTNTVPRGNMRAPGAPQGVFAFESALDELANVAGIDPIEFRRRNLLKDDEIGYDEHPWLEHRGLETLEAAVAEYSELPVPKGWRGGTGIAIYSRATSGAASTSLRLRRDDDGGVSIDLPITETGTGSHTVARELVSKALGINPSSVRVQQVSSSQLQQDAGAGGSRVTVAVVLAVEKAVEEWKRDPSKSEVNVEIEASGDVVAGAYCVHLSQVAVDEETGEFQVLQILTAVDVAHIVNQKAHQMQIDGGVAMGYGYACLEDLYEDEGQVWAANMGEFKIPSARDVPLMRTVLVHGGRGIGEANVKNIGETTTPAVAPSIANAIQQACGARLRDLPLRSERLFDEIQCQREKRPVEVASI